MCCCCCDSYDVEILLLSRSDDVEILLLSLLAAWFGTRLAVAICAPLMTPMEP
jgi:hypothetical protein